MLERWLVVTDMDGTLLNHDDYRFDAALPLLRQMEADNIPVIFNTSKTLAELQVLARQLANRHPFIVENGSAIVIPQGYFASDLVQQTGLATFTDDGYDIIVTGKKIDDIHQFLAHSRPRAIDFSRCDISQAMQLTGLGESEARAAQTRQFSVPLLFSAAQDEQRFIHAARSAGFITLKGGRFLHVLGNCDKGTSMLQLRQLYRQAYQQDFGLIALGDSPNDLDMLRAADRAVVVRSPSSHALNPDHDSIIFTRHSAPEGWVEGVQAMLNLDHEDLIQRNQ